MKRMLVLCMFVGLSGPPLATLFAAETWTKPQQEVADVFKTWAEAEKAGDVDRLMGVTAPSFTGWDLAKPAPIDRTAWRQTAVDFFKEWKVVECTLPPAFIHIEGKTAVAHGRYTETMLDASGAKTTTAGPWTASLVRDGKKWLVLSLGYVEERPKIDEAAIRREVAESVKAWFAAWARCDLEAAMSGVADTPDVFYSDIDGSQADRAGLRKMGADAHVKISAVTFSTLGERTSILAPDTVLYTWHGAVDGAMKDGSAIRYDQMTMTILLRRTDGAWKVFHFHESALPAQPVKPAAPAGAKTDVSAP